MCKEMRKLISTTIWKYNNFKLCIGDMQKCEVVILFFNLIFKCIYWNMGAIKESLTFDDVTLIPQYSSVLPFETITTAKISNKLSLKIPILSSAMDTVTEAKMAIAIAKSGGLGVIHRNISATKQANEVKKVKKKNLIVGAAVGTSSKELDRVYKLLDSGVDLIVVGYTP